MGAEQGGGEGVEGDGGFHVEADQGADEGEGEIERKGRKEDMSKKNEAAWRYNAQLVRVVDGDTVDAMIDLGFSTHRSLRIRFYGMNAPESRTRDKEEKARGLAAKARLQEILAGDDGAFVVCSHGVGKFGRCLGELFTDALGEVSVNQTLIDEGHGVEYFGGKR